LLAANCSRSAMRSVTESIAVIAAQRCAFARPEGERTLSYTGAQVHTCIGAHVHRYLHTSHRTGRPGVGMGCIRVQG
jgi:hypothetical protein